MTDTARVPTAPLALRPTVVTRIALFPVFALPAAFAIAVPSVLAAGAFIAGYAACWTIIARRRLVVDDDGVAVRGVFGHRRVAWDDIDHYTYWSALANARWHGDQLGPERLLDSPNAGVSRVQHHLVLHTASGRRLKVDSFFTGAEHAIARILDEVHRRLAARADDFAPYAIRDDGLAYRDDVLPWRQLEKVVLDGTMPPDVRVMKDRKVLPWAKTSLARIHNGMRFLEQLAARGVVIDPGPRAFVSHALLDRLVRAEGLPRAALVRSKRDRK